MLVIAAIIGAITIPTYAAYEDEESNVNTLFGRQLDSIRDIFSFLPDDILTAIMIIVVFIIILGIVRIVL